EEVPVEAAKERHRTLERVDTEGGPGGLGGGVDEIGALERRRGDLDVDELFRAERLDEEDATAQAGAVPAGRLAHVLGTDADRHLAARVVRQRRPRGGDVRRELQLGFTDLAEEPAVVA